jgi:nicotinate-nucleotide adenylyltransferase
MLKIALFGTSADPPTAAHQAILAWLAQRFDWVAVWSADNPFKSHQTPLEHRAAMLKLLIETIPFHQHQIQLHQELSSPKTLITVERARQRWPGASFTLVIGSDLVRELPRWYQIETLFQQVKLLVVSRPGYALEEADLERLRQMGAEVAIADTREMPPVSSTAYRTSGDSTVLPAPVAAYISQRHLYSGLLQTSGQPSPTLGHP